MNDPHTARPAEQAAAAFVELRPRLIGVAYGLLGTRDGLIATIDAIRNPHKFHGLRTLTAGD